ncbi:MAG TPA: carbon-nitrogen hydrolase family protein [Solirubrobacteraceae bacterium]|nr:carbon-nitrogen hydrolase family protein [Solirubrobacteraceae bacterium]
MDGDDLTVVAVQMASVIGDRIRNLETARHLLAAETLGPRTIVCLPELWSTGHFGSILPVNDAYFDLAEDLEGPTISAMRPIAAAAGCAMVVPFFERTSLDEFFNSAAVIDEHGEILGVYRKLHISHSSNGCEKYYMRPGDDLPVFTLFGWKVGIQICYDRDFPEPARALALAGADLIFYPTSTSVAMRDLWRAVLTTRAYENQVVAIGVGACGRDGSGRYDLLGSSLVAGASGDIADELSVAETGLLRSVVTRGDLRAARLRRFMRRDRREHVYARIPRLDTRRNVGESSPAQSDLLGA